MSSLITFNTYKFGKGGLLINMSDVFNARVGDQNTPLVIQWRQGTTDTAIDLIKNKLHFFAAGQVGNYLEQTDTGYTMSDDASFIEYEDTAGDFSLAHGITSVKLPAQFFPQEGIFYGYFGLKDDQGTQYTAVNVWFRVLGGIPVMGAAIPYFSTQFDALIEKFKGDTSDALRELREKYQAEVKSNEDMSSTTRAALSKLADSVGAIQAQIDAGNVVTLVKHNQDITDTKKKVDDAMADAQKLVESKIAQIDNNVHAYANADAIKNAYPNGTQGVYVAVDTGHQWYYVNGTWTDAGAYQGVGSKEVEDARISSASLGSATYDSAGNAIREQITAVLNTIGDVSVPSVTMQSNSYITSSGTVATYNGLSASDYVPVKAGQLVILQNVSANDNRAAVLYGTSKTLLTSYVYNASSTRVIPVEFDGYLRYTADVNTSAALLTPKYVTSSSLDLTNAQITAVLNAIGDVSVPSVAMQSSSYITSSGALATYDNASLSASDYVPVKAGQLVILQNVSANDNRAAVLYDANKALIGSYVYNSQPVRWIPVSQDGYIRYTDNNDTTTITILTPRFATKNNVVSNPYADMSLFQRVGVIGDSYASGELVTYNGSVPTFTDHYEISWGQILARKHGFKCINYSAGGKTTTSWLADTDHGLQKLLSDDPCELYILALGINDRDHFELGTTDDISTDGTGTAQSFYGCYSKIIYNIIAHAPKAKLILSTLAATDEKSEKFNQAIIDLAIAFKITYIKQSDDAYFTSAAYKNMQGGHPRAVGYSGMAAALDRLIVKCMVNDSYFNDLFM